MKALIVVDVQKDFCPGGALAVPEGDSIIPIINKLLSEFDLVIFTKDWHPARHGGFASSWKDKKPFDTMEVSYQGVSHIEVLWPDHCVQDTPGADFHPDLNFKNCKKDFYIFKKGEDYGEQGYSAFEATDLTGFLDGKNVTNVYVCGLAGDYCCKNTAIDASKQGFNTFFIIDAIKFINKDTTPTLNDLYDADVKIIESGELV
jgi:nicotinamidase/pyrazinamidase